MCVLALGALAGQTVPVGAMETDQYNLPPVPLADIGDLFTSYVDARLDAAIDAVNAEIVRAEACISGRERPSGCGPSEREQARLAELKTPKTLAAAVYKQLGDGSIFTTKTGKWLNSHKFPSEPARYKTSYLDSIFIPRPINYATLSPTVRMYGVEFGTDKMDHLFQQGHQYFEIYRKELAKGKSEADAVRAAIKWGQKTERTYFGTWVSGVYSNADLFANYAGLKFYRGLTETMTVGDAVRPATARLRDGKWHYEHGRKDLLRPFINAHMNEALNPSGLTFILYPVVRRVVRKRACDDWRRAFPQMTRATVSTLTAGLEKWNGEDYGFAKKSRRVTIGETCFEESSRSE